MKHQPSLYWRTELMFARFDSEIHEGDDYLVVRTPSNPQFYWGNFVWMKQAPQEPQQVQRCLDIFKREISDRQPESAHIALGFDHAKTDDSGLPKSLIDMGFNADTLQVLTMNRPYHIGDSIANSKEYRFCALTGEADVAALIELQCNNNNGEYESEGYRRYLTQRMARDKRMTQAGQGCWYGLYCQADQQLVAACGLFNGSGESAKLARYQYVLVDQASRRQGLARQLVAAVIAHGFDMRQLDTQVIAALPGEHAIGLYRHLGFADHSTVLQWQRNAPQDKGAAA